MTGEADATGRTPRMGSLVLSVRQAYPVCLNPPLRRAPWAGASPAGVICPNRDRTLTTPFDHPHSLAGATPAGWPEWSKPLLQRGGHPVVAKALVWQGGRLNIASSGGQTAAKTICGAPQQTAGRDASAQTTHNATTQQEVRHVTLITQPGERAQTPARRRGHTRHTRRERVAASNPPPGRTPILPAMAKTRPGG